ncbi:hypothetical protein BKA69DRAFT_555972 [Paraphysoderma sedebokerense]|nr:hypothetical protein BKA69DRAFT_555972 [Paraphysoderma sedebokerense]
MSFGSSEVVLAVIVGIVTRHSQFIYTHSKIGLVVFVCVIFTFIFGNLSKSPYRRIRHHHKYIRRLHITFGFTSAILGLVNCAFGVERLAVEIADAKYLQYAYYAWIFVVVFMFCYSEYRKRAMKKQKTAPENDVLRIGLTKTVPSFSWEDFNARVADGNLWILVNQCIYSVASFIDIHPGGSEIIYSHIGTDVTDYFYQTAGDAETAMTGVVADSASFDHRGSVQSDLRNRKSNASRRNGPHIHSRTALVTLRSLMVGVIKDSAVQASTAEPREFYPSCIPMSHLTALSIAQFRSLSISRKSIVAGENSDPVYKFTINFPGTTDELWFIPGDYVQIQLTTSDGHTICRPYTPIKTYNKGCLELIIKTYSNGQLTSRLKNLLPGDKVTMRGPLHRDQLMNIDNTTNGCFDNVIMFAAGSGITPIMLLIDYYHRFASRDPANGQLIPKLRLYYQSRSPKDIICYQELESMSKSAGLLEVTHVVSNADPTWKGLQGKINQSMISGWFGEVSSVMPKNAMIVICGPDSFNQSISRALVELGVDKSLLKVL